MQVAQSNYASGLQNLQVEYLAAFSAYRKNIQTVAYFEDAALANAQLITATANTQLANGDINYLQWAQLVNQATTIKSDYVEALRILNESVVQLNYFTSK